jgi:hypothetical protein
MQIYCKACGGQIPAENLQLDRLLGKCSACHAVFSFADQVDADSRLNTEAQEKVPMPPGITVDDFGPGLTVIRRWFSPVFIFLLVFCIAWDTFLLFWYRMAFESEAPLLFKVFPIGHLAVGVGLTYFTLAGFLNRTTLQVESGVVAVRHGPVPWFGNRTFATSDLKQLYCTERFSYHGPHHHRLRTTYQVNAILNTGKKFKVLSGLTDPDQALFVEQAVEDRLGIENRRVRGEMPR